MKGKRFIIRKRMEKKEGKRRKEMAKIRDTKGIGNIKKKERERESKKGNRQ